MGDRSLKKYAYIGWMFIIGSIVSLMLGHVGMSDLLLFIAWCIFILLALIKLEKVSWDEEE